VVVRDDGAGMRVAASMVLDDLAEFEGWQGQW